MRNSSEGGRLTITDELLSRQTKHESEKIRSISSGGVRRAFRKETLAGPRPQKAWSQKGKAKDGRRKEEGGPGSGRGKKPDGGETGGGQGGKRGGKGGSHGKKTTRTGLGK